MTLGPPPHGEDLCDLGPILLSVRPPTLHAYGHWCEPSHSADLPDGLWHRLRRDVFTDPAGAADLRVVTAALLLRERARCPWPLLPPGLPPADRLRAVWAEWRSDGTWVRVRRCVTAYVLDQTEADASGLRRLRRAVAERLRGQPGGDTLVAVGRALLKVLPSARRLSRVRRAGARALRRVPGGAALLRPARAAVQAAERVASRFTVHAQLPGWFRTGHEHLTAGEYEAAVALFTRVLDHDPPNFRVRLQRAYAYHRDGRHAAACADCWAALAAPGLDLGAVAQAHFILSQSKALGGDPEGGVGHGYLGRLFQLYGPEADWERADGWDRGGDGVGPAEYELVTQAYYDLAEFAINQGTDFDTAAVLYEGAGRNRDRYARWLEERAPRTLFLSEDWVRNIGHTALIDFLVKMDRLGWRTWDRMVLIAPPGVTANPAYVDHYRPFFDIVRVANVPPGLRHLTSTLGPRVASLFHHPDGSHRYITEGMGRVQEAWERDGREPLLRLSPDDLEFGREGLREMGVPDGAWFVSLHVRSAGYHKEGQLTNQAHRNASVEAYLSAAKEVVRRGGWVIRLGDPSMEPLPPTPGVIDYARGRHKSARMDVFLCGACRFFVGGPSGITHVPTTFGVPCVVTNWLTNALPVYSKHDLFVPKLLRSVPDGRVLPFREALAPATRRLGYSQDRLTECDLEALPNTPDEIRGVVAEMLDRLDGTVRYTPGERAALAEYDRVARASGLAGFSRIGRDFLTKHAALLPGAAARGPLRRAA